MKKILICSILIVYFIVYNSNIAVANDNVLNFKNNNIEHYTLSKAVNIAINSLGDIAIGFKDYHINVYDKNGEFKNGYSFYDDGTYFFEFDEEDNIMIFTVRGSTCYYFTENAQFLRSSVISDSYDSEYYYRIHSNKRFISVDGMDYVLKQTLGHTRLIKADTNGNETIIYDMGSKYTLKILAVIFLLIIVLLIIVRIVKTIKKQINIV